MAEKFLDTSLFDKAVRLAVEAHSGIERRGKGTPYILHPMEAAQIVSTMTTDQEILCAAILHDTVEDTSVTLDDIKEQFGSRVAALVAGETSTPADSDPIHCWRSGKEQSIDNIDNASIDGKMASLGDKLSNMRAIAADYRVMGDELWNRFHAPGGKKDIGWYYHQLCRALEPLDDYAPYQEFHSLVDEVFGEAGVEDIDLSEFERTGEGYTADSYTRADHRRMLKLYRPFISEGVPAKEMSIPRHIRKLGLNVPIAYRVIRSGDRTGVEFQNIWPKKSISRAIADQPERMDEFIRDFARQARILHSTVCDTDFFPSAKQRFHDIVDSDTIVSEEARRNAHALINSTPEATTCLHGDFHIGNILLSGSHYYWIDLADFTWGHPLFDLGMFYLSCRMEDDAALVDNIFHQSLETMSSLWDVFKQEYFGGAGNVPSDFDLTCRKYGALYYMLFSGRESDVAKFRRIAEDIFTEEVSQETVTR